MQDGSHNKADQHTEHGIGQFCQGIGEGRIVSERRNRGGHHLHACHQNGKAHHDIGEILLRGMLRQHFNQNTGYGYHGGDGGRGQKLCHSARTLHIRKAENPARYTGTDIRPKDNADGLKQLHHPGIHKTDDHYRCGGRRLDDGSHACAQQNSLDGSIAHPVQKFIEFVSCYAF